MWADLIKDEEVKNTFLTVFASIMLITFVPFLILIVIDRSFIRFFIPLYLSTVLIGMIGGLSYGPMLLKEEKYEIFSKHIRLHPLEFGSILICYFLSLLLSYPNPLGLNVNILFISINYVWIKYIFFDRSLSFRILFLLIPTCFIFFTEFLPLAYNNQLLIGSIVEISVIIIAYIVWKKHKTNKFNNKPRFKYCNLV